MNYFDALVPVAVIIIGIFTVALCALRSIFYKRASKAPSVNRIDLRKEETRIAIPESNTNNVHQTLETLSLHRNENIEKIRPPGSLKGCYPSNLKRQSAITTDEFLISEIKNSLKFEPVNTVENDEDIIDDLQSNNSSIQLKDCHKLERKVSLRRSKNSSSEKSQLKFLLELNEDFNILKINLIALKNLFQILNEKPIERRKLSRILLDEQRGKLKRFLSSIDLTKSESLDMSTSKRLKLKISIETKFSEINESLKDKMNRRVSLMTKSILQSSNVEYFKTDSLNVDTGNQQACKYVKVEQTFLYSFNKPEENKIPELFSIKFTLHDDDIKVKIGKIECEISYSNIKARQSLVFNKEFKHYLEDKPHEELYDTNNELNFNENTLSALSIYVSVNCDMSTQKMILMLNKIKIPIKEIIKNQSKIEAII
jgi:hypothetical protein